MSASCLSIQPADRVIPVDGYMQVDTGKNAVQLPAGERTGIYKRECGCPG